MSLPEFCYKKAFWVIVTILCTVIISTTGMGYSMILDNSERSIQNENELAYRQQIVELIPKIYQNQIIICTEFKLNCVK